MIKYVTAANRAHHAQSQGHAGACNLICLFLVLDAQKVGHGGIDAHAGAHCQGDHQQLKGVDDGQGRQAVAGVTAHEETVYNIVKGLDQLSQHHRRRQLQQDPADPFGPKKSTDLS